MSTTQDLSQIGQRMQAEMIDALLKDPSKILVETPGFGAARMTAAEVIEDQCSGQGNTDFLQMLRIVAKASQSTDPALRLPAQALIAGMAHEYAAYHQDDAAALEAEDAGGRPESSLLDSWFAGVALPRVSRV
jgi:hypothetical protein